MKSILFSSNKIILKKDKYLGVTLTPSRFTEIETPQFKYDVYTNQYGCRDINMKYWHDCVDILYCSDSWGFGVGLDYRDTLCGILSTEYKLRLLNASIPGYSLLQIIRRTEVILDTIKPKILVIGYCDGLVNRSFVHKIYKSAFERPFIYKKRDYTGVGVMEILGFWERRWKLNRSIMLCDGYNASDAIELMTKTLDDIMIKYDMKCIIYKYTNLRTPNNYLLIETPRIKILKSKIPDDRSSFIIDGDSHPNIKLHRLIAEELSNALI
jgi:hypothetical protein